MPKDSRRRTGDRHKHYREDKRHREDKRQRLGDRHTNRTSKSKFWLLHDDLQPEERRRRLSGVRRSTTQCDTSLARTDGLIQVDMSMDLQDVDEIPLTDPSLSEVQHDSALDWMSSDIPEDIRRPWEVFQDDLDYIDEEGPLLALIKMHGAFPVFVKYLSVASQCEYARVSQMEVAGYLVWRRTSPGASLSLWEGLSPDDKAELVPDNYVQVLQAFPSFSPLFATGPPPCGASVLNQIAREEEFLRQCGIGGMQVTNYPFDMFSADESRN